MITQQRLKEVLHYDPETGVFIWKVKVRRIKIGDVAGSLHNATGYLRIMIGGKIYRSHRLAWLYVHGSFPDDEIDHINGNRADNRIVNLREATHKQNGENRKLNSNGTTGYRGVHFRKRLGKYQAHVAHHGRRYHLGSFNTAEEAAAAAKGARDLLFSHDNGRDAL